MGVMISFVGYSLEMFCRIELNAGEITTINTNAFQTRFYKPLHRVTKGMQNKDTI